MPAVNAAEGAGRGFIIESTTIAVDFWPSKDDPSSTKITHYFLTSCHPDSIVNLDATWDRGTIYCSEITKNLLKRLHKIPDKWIESLNTMAYGWSTFDLDDGEEFTMTCIKANHIRGGYMFLFKGEFGVVLATGGFRYYQPMFIESELSNFIGNIDICYLDNTHFNPVFAKMPTRQQAIELIVEYMDKAMATHKGKCLFSIKHWKLGKEELVIDLAKHYNTKIVVGKQRYNLLVKDMRLEKQYFKKNKLNANSLIVWETDSSSSNEEESAKELGKVELSIFLSTFYSEHSSYPEIIEFVKWLNPKRVVPIVPKNRLDVCNLNELDNILEQNRPLPCRCRDPRQDPVPYEELIKLTSAKLGSLRLDDSICLLDDENTHDQVVVERQQSAQQISEQSFTRRLDDSICLLDESTSQAESTDDDVVIEGQQSAQHIRYDKSRTRRLDDSICLLGESIAQLTRDEVVIID